MSKNTLLLVGLFAIAGIVIVGQMMMKKPATQMQEESPEAMMEASASPTTAPVMDGEDKTGDAMDGETMLADDQVVTINMEAGAFYFEPNMIKVKKGQTVRVVFNSVDMMHDFNIAELNVKSEIVKSGETSTIEFVADQVGSFEYFCSVGQHRQNGQVGTLVVEE